jgi:molybdate transport system regulatory protein
MKYSIKNRIWIESDEGTFLGEGRIELLTKIDEYGSISKAAKDMNMSYNKALKLVNSMNTHGKKPLVKQSVGGQGGGGTSVTKEGKNAIRFFEELESKSNTFLNEELKNMKL